MNIHQYLDNKLSLITIIFFVIFMGIFYQVAWQYPVIDSFPLIERLLDSSYLVNDFYTNTFDDFSPRLILASCIVWLSETFDIHYTYVVAYLNIIRIWVYATGLYLFYRQLATPDIALIAFSISALSFLSVPFLPAWWPVTFDLTASNVALVFAMYAWVMFLKKKIASALLLLTAATIFHPLVGVHSAIISAILFVSCHGFNAILSPLKKPSTYIAGVIFCIVFFSFYFSFDKVLDDLKFVEINGIYRHGHHFLFRYMDIEKWISTSLMLITSLLLIYKLEIPSNIKRISLSIFIYALTLTVLSYIFIEVIPTRFMVSFIPLRAFPILVPLVVIIWSYYALTAFKLKNYIGFMALLLPFLPYHKLGLTWYLFPEQHELTLPIFTIILALAINLTISRYPAASIGINTKIHIMLNKISSSEKPSILLLPISLIALVIAVIKFEVYIPTVNSEPPIYLWLISNSKPSDVVLAELNGANNQKIRLLAKRSVIVSKDFPFNEHFYEQWYERYKNVYIHRDEARGHIDRLSPDQLNSLMDQYKANILIRTVPLQDNLHFQLVGESKGEIAPVFIYRNSHLEA
jgi:hypothetical protein